MIPSSPPRAGRPERGSGRSPLGATFETQARWCAEAGAHLYATLLSGMADDVDAGGVVADLCADADGAGLPIGVQVNLLAALHEIVLAGHAPELEAYYPSVGGTWDPAGVWPVAAAVLLEHVERVRPWIATVPQTNEVGRSAGLAVGLLTAASLHSRSRIRLLQLGASAGLHLLVDSFRIEGQGWGWGPHWSPVRLPAAVRGQMALTPVAPGGPDDLSRILQIVERRGCDLAPIDVHDPVGRRRLQAYIWPDDDTRHERLAAALELAENAELRVDAQDAATWLAERLAEPTEPDVLTVVWSSVTLQYLPAAQRARIGELVARAGEHGQVAQLALESVGSHYLSPPLLTLDGRTLGSSPPHGLPVTLRRATLGW